MKRALLVIACAMVGVPSAFAHGGPATEALESGSLYVPIDGNIAPPAAARVRKVIHEARAKGYAVKVALIASPSDLGVDFDLWRRPERYAADLARQLAAGFRGRVVVVMPQGIGVARHGRPVPERSAVAGIRVANRPNALADAAVNAIARLANAMGVIVAVPPPAHAFSAKNTDSRDRIVIATVGAAVGVGLVAVGLRRRKA